MMRKVCCLILMALFACHALPLDNKTIFIGERAEGDLDWWEGGNFYQIYPRSWKDSDGDGIGDIPGITEKVQYLRDIGMDGVWLSPIFKSPMADFGYDISDYRDIYELFGTLEDFDALLAKCNEIGLKLILDLVPNHTSDEHEWFLKSERREPGYENYYIWHPGSFDPATGRRIPPNNWISVFTGSAWKWSPIRKQFYYHAFLDKQPDLNYRNPRVVQEMKDVMTYWIEKGVAGFRIDAVPFCYEVNKDARGHYPDEPLSNNPDCTNPEFYCYHNHPFTQDQDETYSMVYSWRKHLNDFQRKHPTVPTKIMMIEAYTSLENKIKFYGDDKHEGANIPFNFEMISNVNDKSTAADYMKTIKAWLDNLPKGKQANWVLGNHDSTRLASRLGPTRADMINIMLQTLPGVAVTYQGEELALENVEISYKDTVDPQGCNVGPENYKAYSRDPARTPFPWDTTTSAGFSTNETTWLPLGEDFKDHNVQVELAKENSHLKIFIKLTKLRQKDVMKRGSYAGKLVNNNNVIIYLRMFSETDFVAVALNFGTSTETVNFKENFPVLPAELNVYTASLSSGIEEGSSVDTSAVAVPSDVGIVLTNVVV